MTNKKHIRNIKIYHATHKSFFELKNKAVFLYLDYSNNKYKELLIEFLVEVVKEVNYKDAFHYDEFTDFISDIIMIIEIHHDIELPEFMKRKIVDELYDIYYEKMFPHFRGEVLELLIVYLKKSNNNKIYHEPFFYYKRKRLFKNQFKGEDCLIDIVSRDKRNSNMVLIECKVNLDNRIKRINSKRDKFKNKLRLMDELEKELTKYVNKEKRYVKVNKILASIKVPSRTLPHHYQNYHYINLYDYFRLNKNIQHH